jgi:hypothetical protein
MSMKFNKIRAWTTGEGHTIEFNDGLIVELGDETIFEDFLYDGEKEKLVIHFKRDEEYAKSSFMSITFEFEVRSKLKYSVEGGRPREHPPNANTHEGFMLNNYLESDEAAEFTLYGDGWNLEFVATSVKAEITES